MHFYYILAIIYVLFAAWYIKKDPSDPVIILYGAAAATYCYAGYEESKTISRKIAKHMKKNSPSTYD